MDEDALVFEWAYNHKIPEFTWMEVRADSHDGTTMLWRFQDHGGDDGHSMARCTGLVTLCCIEQWLDDPDMLPPGVHAPEELSAEILDSILVTMAEELIEVEQVHQEILLLLVHLKVVVVELLLMVLLDILTPPQGLEMREDSVQLKGMLEEMLLIGPLGTITTTLVQVEAVAVRAVLEGMELPLAKHGQAVLVVMAVLV